MTKVSLGATGMPWYPKGIEPGEQSFPGQVSLLQGPGNRLEASNPVQSPKSQFSSRETEAPRKEMIFA